MNWRAAFHMSSASDLTKNIILSTEGYTEPSNLKNPETLEHFEYQGEEPQGQKYALFFNKSSKYDLKVVVSIKEALNVVTAHIQSKRIRKVLDKWLKMQK